MLIFLTAILVACPYNPSNHDLSLSCRLRMLKCVDYKARLYRPDLQSVLDCTERLLSKPPKKELGG